MFTVIPSTAESISPELLGIDIGGTAIKLGRFDRRGNLLAELDVPTPQPQMPGAVCQAVVEAVAALDPERRADRVGIGLPVPTDRDGRIARLAINILVLLVACHDISDRQMAAIKQLQNQTCMPVCQG